MYALGKELRGEAIGEQNRHKRLAKRVFTVFRGREPWITVKENWQAKYFEEITQVQAEELNNIWILTELEESLGGDLWIQNLTLAMDAVSAAPQEIWDLPQETHNKTPQILLAGCNLAELSLAKLSLIELSLAKLSLAELSLAKLSLVEPSHDQLTEYD